MEFPEEKELTLDGKPYFFPKEDESLEDYHKRIEEEFLEIYGELPDPNRDYRKELQELFAEEEDE